MCLRPLLEVAFTAEAFGQVSPVRMAGSHALRNRRQVRGWGFHGICFEKVDLEPNFDFSGVFVKANEADQAPVCSRTGFDEAYGYSEGAVAFLSTLSSSL